MKKSVLPSKPKTLPKSPTGIQGLDEITGGGLPSGRPTLVCGNAGCGKTLLGMEFLYRGATEFNEPGVFVAFEETEKELTANVASLGFDLDKLVAQKKMVLDHIFFERSEIKESGEFDLGGLFIRLNYLIESIGAKRIVLDTIESLFGSLPNEVVLRSELRRLFRWLKDKGVTAIITGERGDTSLTRQGMEEYVSDCVILLDNRVTEQYSIRRLRIVKYRGSEHGTNEYPFLIEDKGISVVPITSIGLTHNASLERVSSGLPGIDAILDGKGYFRGSSILVSGRGGSGKSSLCAHITHAACQRGERVMYFALEESPDQIVRNMRSIGINLEPWIKKNLLKINSNRLSFYGLESYLTNIHREITQFKPKLVILDPISSFIRGGNVLEAKSMLIRLLDFLKSNNITAFITSLTSGDSAEEKTSTDISSIIDTWLVLRDIEISGELNRGLYVLKSRGMAHSSQIREFRLTSNGVELLDIYLGPDGVLTGSARVTQEEKELAAGLLIKQERDRIQSTLERKRKAMALNIEVLKTAFEAEEAEIIKSIENAELRMKQVEINQNTMAKSRNLNNDEKNNHQTLNTKLHKKLQHESSN